MDVGHKWGTNGPRNCWSYFHVSHPFLVSTHTQVMNQSRHEASTTVHPETQAVDMFRYVPQSPLVGGSFCDVLSIIHSCGQSPSLVSGVPLWMKKIAAPTLQTVKQRPVEHNSSKVPLPATLAVDEHFLYNPTGLRPTNWLPVGDKQLTHFLRHSHLIHRRPPQCASAVESPLRRLHFDQCETSRASPTG